MNEKRRIVVDTSTLVSAALVAGSTPFRALVKALEIFELCVSVETLAELEEVLSRAKFDRYRDRDSRRAFVETIRRHSTLVAIDLRDQSAIDPPCRDSTDVQFLMVALAAGAAVVVSSDQDLTVLNPWRGIPILTPAEFLANFGE